MTTGGTENVLAFTTVLAIVTGVIALAAGLLRLGFLANFISEPVLKGFIIGLALTIIIGQVPELLGIDKVEGDFFAQLWGVLRHLGDTQGRTFVVGAASLAIVLALRRWAPMVPGSLVAVIFGVAVVKLFDLEAKGVEIVGEIDSGLPRIGLPTGTVFGDYLDAAAASAGIMLVGFAGASARRRPTPPALTTRSIPTASCSASAPPTSAPGSPAGWSSTAACQRSR